MQQQERLLIMKLDMKKSYGIVSGMHHGAAFEQEGHLFDADGEEVVESSDTTIETVTPEVSTTPKATAKNKVGVRAKKKAAVAPVAAPEAPASAVDSQLAAQGL